MCRAVTCQVCGKTTWAGCGQHVDTVKAGVRAADWCNGQHAQAEIDASRAGRPNLLARLFGR